MNCRDIADLLDNGQMLELTPARQAAVTEHLGSCESCAGEWHALRALAEAARRPVPPPPADLFARTMLLAEAAGASAPSHARQRHSFWLGAGVGGALAAGIVLAVLTLGVAPRVADPEAPVPGITIALNEPHDVGVAIDSVEALTDAEIRVVLTGGVRLAGFSDRSLVSWRTSLDRGVNRLTLPVIAVDPAGGQVLVEVAHGSKRQVFLVKVGVDASADGVAGLGGKAADLAA